MSSPQPKGNNAINIQPKAVRRAVIDLGTVSARLMIADTNQMRAMPLLKKTTITQLGKNLTRTGRLSAESLEATAAAIDSFIEIMARYGLSPSESRGQIVAIATSASRDASNSDELEAILESREIPLRIISGQTEARLSFAGASCGLDDESLLVFDIGGGSTEVVVGAPYRMGESPADFPLRSISFDVGCRRMTDIFFSGERQSADELERAKAWAREQFETFFEPGERRPEHLVGVAGTVTSIVSMAQRMIEYDPSRVDGATVDRATAERLLSELSGMTQSEREHFVGLQPKRAGVIVAGIAILIALFDAFGADSCTASEQDNLLGTMLLWPL